MSLKPPSSCDPGDRPLPRSAIGKKVRVHLNLHNGCYSVSVGGKVQGYTHALALRDVTTHVLKSGYKRCRDENKRNVHAFLQGTLVAAGKIATLPEGAKNWRKVSYNCLTHPPCFYFTDDGACLTSAYEVVAYPGGKVWALVRGPKEARKNGDESLRDLERTAVNGGSLADWIRFDEAHKRLVGVVPAKAEYAEPLRAAMERRDKFGEDRNLWSKLSRLDQLLSRSERALLLRDYPLARLADRRDTFELTSHGKREIDEGATDLYDGLDLVRISGDMKLGHLWLPSGLTCGDYVDGHLRTRSNRAVFLDRFSERPGIYAVTGGFHYQAVAVRLDVTDEEVVTAIESVQEGESLDETHESNLEQEERNEAWGNWLAYDFRRLLTPHAESLLNKTCVFASEDDEDLRGLFDRFVEEEDWIDESQGPSVRTEEVVERITARDLRELDWVRKSCE